MAGVGRVSGKSRHLENTALLFVWPSISQIYFGAVPRARDPVQPNLVEQIAADAYPPDCHNAAVLTHADNRIVSAISDVKIGPLVQARVASPIDVVRIYFDGRQVDRQIQCERGDAFNPTLWAREDLVGRHPEDDEIDHRYRVVERLADEKLPHHWRLSVDDAPEPPAHPVAEPGDLWVLGRHRLLCGDSTVATDVARVLGGVAPHLMVTDPPYGVNYDPAWRKQAGPSINGTTQRIATGTVIKPIGARAVGKVVNDDRADWREAWALFPGSVAYIWHAGTKAGIVQDSLAACGFETRSQIIWAKNNFAIGRGHYHCKHEPCWYVVRKGSTASWVGDHSQTTLWQIDKNLKSETGHGTQKPVECMRRPIENNASPGQAVYEPFSGSGTTIIAAEMTGRVCHAIEIAPAYVDVAVKRWQEFTGQQAVLDGDGRSFDDVAAQRAR